jgi:hypothetical protein
MALRKRFHVEGEAVGPARERVLIDMDVDVYDQNSAPIAALRMTEKQSNGRYPTNNLIWAHMRNVIVTKIKGDAEQLPLLEK